MKKIYQKLIMKLFKKVINKTVTEEIPDVVPVQESYLEVCYPDAHQYPCSGVDSSRSLIMCQHDVA